MSQKLLEIAALARTVVAVAGEDLIVREPSYLQRMAYAKRLKDDPTDAIAYLITATVIKEDGTPVYTKDEALILAGSRAEVITPIINAMLSFTPDDEKKALTA